MADTKEPIRIKFSKELHDLLRVLEDENSYIAFEMLWLNEPNSKYHNGLGISDVNISKTKSCLDVTSTINGVVDGKVHPMKIENFLKFYFKNYFQTADIQDFIEQYDILAGGGSIESIAVNKITPEPFSYNPKDVRSTFISLVTKTYPHGHEEEVMAFMPKLDKDIVGNYYKIIGENPTTMFTSHLDTADRKQGITKLLSKKDEKGDEIIYTDGSTILGADDKSGVAVMLYMMAHNVPGLYYFFMGEERGGIGSGLLSSVYEKVEYVKNIKRCVSFDRRDVCSVITSQLGRTCCSDDFGTALAKQYNANGLNLSLDPTGIYTDSASFLEQIAECTNISVGYYSEHTGKERQNINFLERLAKASVQVNWDSLPTVRKVGIDEETIRKYGKLINDIKATPFGIDIKIASDRATTFIQCDLEEGYIDETYEALTTLQFLLNKHKVSQKIYFDAEYIKIDLL
jgi:transcriptional regulator with XRE-family HTH domain